MRLVGIALLKHCHSLWDECDLLLLERLALFGQVRKRNLDVEGAARLFAVMVVVVDTPIFCDDPYFPRPCVQIGANLLLDLII
jgi:hypothetical protein